MLTPKIAIVYDRINTFGGAEQVLLALHDAFPHSVLFTSVYHKGKTGWLKSWPIRTSFLQAFPFARAHHEWFGWLMPLIFESLDLSEFDIVLSVTSEAAKGVITRLDQLHICYCLTPTRYLWSHTHSYEGERFSWFARLFFSKLRRWDFLAAQRPDVIIPISKLVSARVRKYYRRECEDILYPPVKVEGLRSMEDEKKKKHDAARPSTLSPSPYYLVVSRLVPYKRIDLAIKACLQLGVKLVIVGVGSDEARLQTMAGNSPLIEFAGFVSDERLTDLYRQAQALLCPQEEDFGIVSLEAQLQGTPVISYRFSGMAETIIEGKTGLLCVDQTVESLVKAILQLHTLSLDAEVIRTHALSWRQEVFVRKMRDIVSDLYQLPKGVV